MKKKKRMCKLWCIFLLSLLLLNRALLSGMVVQAATGATLTMTGLEVGDFVEVYRIASYKESDGSYSWEATVADWIQNDSEGKAYKGLKPTQLSQMAKTGAKEFCQTLIVGLKNESKGIANLDGYTFRIEEEKEQYQVENISPGYYIVLPKGATRIYELKWLEIPPGSQPQISYDKDAKDYQVPTVKTTVENKTEDRDKVRDAAFAIEGDELEVSATISIPSYPDMYATGKRILNITVIVPKGMVYKEDSLKLSLKDTSAYSVGTYEKATTYETADGEILFFGTPQGYFYEVNGSLLVSDQTVSEAVAKYNEIHETEYMFEEQDSTASGEKETTGETESTEETETPQETEATEEAETPQEAETTGQTEDAEETKTTDGTEDAEEVMLLTAEDDSTKLTAHAARTVFVIALDTEQDISELTLEYQAVKNSAASDTGTYDNTVALSYSVSPLDSNLMYSVTSAAAVSSYSITIVACEGSGESINMTTEEKLEKSPRFSGVVFTLYRLSNTYDGDTTAGTEVSETAETGETTETSENAEAGETTETGETIETSGISGTAAEDTDEDSAESTQLIYDEDADKTYEYTYVATLTTNEQGMASIGGLEPDEYLIDQTVYPSGYTLSDASLKISKDAWTDETVMEGDDDLFVLWLEFETRYLPGTGKEGIAAYVFLGSLISISALLILFRRYYPQGLPELLEKIKKV